MKPVCCNCSCGRLAFLMEVKAPRYGHIGELFLVCKLVLSIVLRKFLQTS